MRRSHQCYARTLRSMRQSRAMTTHDILIHWDDDDYSHPNRIAEQVALLKSSGADVVGFSEMLSWRETPQAIKDQYAEVQPLSDRSESTGTPHAAPPDAPWRSMALQQPRPAVLPRNDFMLLAKDLGAEAIRGDEPGAKTFGSCTGLKCVGVSSFSVSRAWWLHPRRQHHGIPA